MKRRFLFCLLALAFGIKGILFALPWEEEVYNDAPAAIYYGAWLQNSADINNMKRLLVRFAIMYNNVKFDYEEANGNIFRRDGIFKYNGDNYWYIWDSSMFVIHINNKNMFIMFSEPIVKPEDKYSNVTFQILIRTIDAFIGNIKK